jgi:hypothetical protein
VTGRASALLILGVALAACRRDGPEDPALAAAGAGIPIGAVGAVGASFDGPSGPPVARMTPPAAPHPRRPVKSPAPPDPFADPPGSSGDGGAPIHPPPSKGTTL